ncbi:MAG: hypothetical protein WDM76_19505 [Limisphaerales bacterium]
MNGIKLEKLFAAARKANPLTPTDGFEFLVMNVIRREPKLRATTMSDQLNAWFPRLAWTAILIIALCIMGDWFIGTRQMDLTDGVAQLSQQWLLTGGGL